jgi:hypothetical protein
MMGGKDGGFMGTLGIVVIVAGCAAAVVNAALMVKVYVGMKAA